MTDPTDGGTVRYHRADWVPERDRWVVTFPNGRVQGFTAEQGEAMGLTPPEPEPPSPIDTDVAELVELIDRYGAMGVALTLLAHDDITNVDDFLDSLLERWMELRDARQDPQPAVASEPWPWGDEGYMCPKMVRETLCVAQAAVGRSPEVDARRVEHVERISRLINLCDRHRPLGPDGKHGTRQCTPTCGCEDKREPITPVQPTTGTPSDDIDFDALPDGTVLLRTDGRPGVRIKVDGVWTFDGHGIAAPLLRKNWKVHQPAPLSPGECLRGLLAGPDFERMLREAKGLNPAGRSSWACLMRTVGAAAREVRDV